MTLTENLPTVDEMADVLNRTDELNTQSNHDGSEREEVIPDLNFSFSAGLASQNLAHQEDWGTGSESIRKAIPSSTSSSEHENTRSVAGDLPELEWESMILSNRSQSNQSNTSRNTSILLNELDELERELTSNNNHSSLEINFSDDDRNVEPNFEPNAYFQRQLNQNQPTRSPRQRRRRNSVHRYDSNLGV